LKIPLIKEKKVQANLHELLSTLSPWGTLDDLELIHTCYDPDEDVTPLWLGAPGHEDAKSEMDAVQKLVTLMTDFFSTDHSNQEEHEAAMAKMQVKFEGERKTDLPALLCHVFSIILDDHFEFEFGF
jgi:hypothetical protein